MIGTLILVVFKILYFYEKESKKVCDNVHYLTYNL